VPKKRQPDLLKVDIPGERKKAPEPTEKERPRKENKSVAEFSVVGDWGHPVHLTGFLVHVPDLSSSTPRSAFQQVIESLSG